MKLFPYQPPPPAVRGWHVPVPKVKLTEIVDPTWDLTLQKIVPHVDGVNDVRRVAWLADVSLPLCQVALRHLLYYDTILLLDMFFFASCYAPRPAIHDFVANRDGLIDECAGYVCIGPPPSHASATATTPAIGSPAASGADLNSGKSPGENDSHGHPDDGSHSISTSLPTTTASTPATGTAVAATTSSTTKTTLTHYQLIRLMTTFCAGRSVMEWVKLHQDTGLDVLRHVDVRRLVQFGVIKGLLYRVHKYVVSRRYLAQLATGQVTAAPSRKSSALGAGVRNGTGVSKSASASGRGGSHASAETRTSSERGKEGIGKGKEKEREHTAEPEHPNPLRKYTDGAHCFDQIITEQNMTDSEIMEKLKSFQAPAGDLAVFYR